MNSICYFGQKYALFGLNKNNIYFCSKSNQGSTLSIVVIMAQKFRSIPHTCPINKKSLPKGKPFIG